MHFHYEARSRSGVSRGVRAALTFAINILDKHQAQYREQSTANLFVWHEICDVSVRGNKVLRPCVGRVSAMRTVDAGRQMTNR